MADLPASMFMNSGDLLDLTGQAKPILQARWLKSKAIPFIMGGDGALKVSRQSLLDIMEREVTGQSLSDKTSLDGLAEVAGHWDKVTEKMMADLIGSTAKALQAKRSRGVIPDGVWLRLDGRIMYSLKRYEAWLDSQWPAYIAPQPAPGRTPGRKRHTGTIYKLV